MGSSGGCASGAVFDERLVDRCWMGAASACVVRQQGAIMLPKRLDRMPGDNTSASTAGMKGVMLRKRLKGAEKESG